MGPLSIDSYKLGNLQWKTIVATKLKEKDNGSIVNYKQRQLLSVGKEAVTNKPPKASA